MIDRVKALCFFTSAALILLAKNPSDFLEKLQVRLRVNLRRGKEKSEDRKTLEALTEEHRLAHLIRVGDIQGAQTLIRSARLGKAYLQKGELRSKMEQVNLASFTYPRSNSKVSASNGTRVVYYATNSLPHTQSGYSLRTHSLAKSLGMTVKSVCVITRFGYPLVVGRVPSSTIEVSWGVRYYRSFDWFYPAKMENRLIREVANLEKLCRQERATVIHTTTNFRNAIVCSIVAARLGIPWVYEVRGEPEKTWLSKVPVEEQNRAVTSHYFRTLRQAETNAMLSADFVLTLSRVSKAEIVRRGVPPEKVEVIPNAVEQEWLNLEFSKYDLRQELGIPLSEKVIGTVTSLVSYEGIDVAIRAMKNLGDDYIFLIVGDGEERERLETLSKNLKLEDRVKFVGRVPSNQAWKWYGTFDFFVVPRVDTPVCRTVTPMKPVLAQALGIPVVASDLPALREICGGTGTFFRAGCEHGLAEAIANAAGQDNACKGKEWASQYTWERNSQKLLNVYSRLTGKTPA